MKDQSNVTLLKKKKKNQNRPTPRWELPDKDFKAAI